MIEYKEAQQKIGNYSRSFGHESIGLGHAWGRVLAEDVFADRPYPPFHRAAMDGYAIRWVDFMENSLREFRVVKEIHAGDDANITMANPGETVKIMTGAATPTCFDSIIRVEDSEIISPNLVRFAVDGIKKGQNIAKKGEDVATSTLILSKGTYLNGPELGALATVGKATLIVEKLPRIALFSTGNEIKPVAESISPVQIRDSNRYALEGFLKKYNCQPTVVQLLRDSKEAILAGLASAKEADIIVLTGGVSAGDADYVPSLLKESGFEEIFHKVKIKPGKPFWFGAKGNTTVFALPGNPMSCQVGFNLFIVPFFRKCFGLHPSPVFNFPMADTRNKKVKLDEFFPCKIIDNQLVEIKTNGSGDIRAAIGSDGLAIHPMDREHIEKGQPIEFFFW